MFYTVVILPIFSVIVGLFTYRYLTPSIEAVGYAMVLGYFITVFICLVLGAFIDFLKKSIAILKNKSYNSYSNKQEGE